MNETSKISLMVPAGNPNAADQLRKYADGKDWVEYAMLSSIAARIDWLEARNAATSPKVNSALSYLAIQRLITASQAMCDAEIGQDHRSAALSALLAAVNNAKQQLALG
jgi:hypothetical protein